MLPVAPDFPPMVNFAACALIWGGSWFAIKVAVEGADPIGVAALRTALAFVLLAALGLAARLAKPRRAEVLRAMAVGTVFIGANFALVYWSAPRLPVGFSTLVYATAPLQATLLSGLGSVEVRLGPRRLLGLAAGIAGIAVAFGGLRQFGQVAPLATVAVFLAATTSAAGTAMARRWKALHPVWMNAFANLSASLLLWLEYAANGHAPPVPQTQAGWVGFLYMLVGGSVLAFLLYFSLVRQWDATRATFTSLVTPFVALLVGAALATEPILLPEVLGAALVLVAGIATLRAPAARGPSPQPSAPFTL